MSKVYNRLTCVHFALFVYDRISDANTHLWKGVKINRIICMKLLEIIYMLRKICRISTIYILVTFI